MSGYKREFPYGPGKVCEIVEQEQSAKRVFLSPQGSRAYDSISTHHNYDIGHIDGEQSSSAHTVSHVINGGLDCLESTNVLGSPSSHSTPISTLSPSNDESTTLASSVSGSSGDGQVFCFGMIVNASLKLLGRSIIPKEFMLPPSPQGALRFRFRPDAITLLLPTSKECGVLDSKTSHVLRNLLQENKSLRFEAFVDQEQTQPPYLRKRSTSILPLSITVYGSITSSAKVASLLSEASVYLQEPTYFNPGTRYYNPHFLSWDEDMITPQLRQSCVSRPLDLVAEVQAILDQTDPVGLSDWPKQDYRIRTGLQNHQLAALQFMIAREGEYFNDRTHSLWELQCRSGRDIFVHSITHAEQPKRPWENRGGLLADEMGMGKSLTVLAVILHTLDNVRALPCRDQERSCSRATLIVAPKSVLYSWEAEIKKHTYPNALKVQVYHGMGTFIDYKILENSDVVLTTYETASLDHFKKGILRNTSWFRVVLDEAHQIRNRSTKTFQAIMSLDAQRRWCITGTPVQNKLDDLFSLTEFLRFYPVDNYSNTRKYVMEPLGRKDERVLADLRSILTTVALRRTKAACQIRKRLERVDLVILTPKEREKYDLILTNARRILSGSAGATSSPILLQSILQLRQICSHGSPKINSNLENGFQQLREASNCSECGDSLVTSPTPEGAVQNCQGNQLCHDCALGWNNNSPDMVSPCSPLSQAARPVIHISASEDNISRNVGIYQNETGAGVSQGSSKVEKVLSNLAVLGQASLDNQAPIKSLVFSCWTRTLDCLGLALADRGMPYVRIDGSQSLSERALMMDRFRLEPSLRIMLLSTGCGSVGLNLTAASYVHIVEPQWNPMVEAQAAARVDRLDQTKDIVIIRYIVEHSIEQRIQARQRNKVQIAELSASRMANDPAGETSNDFQSLESLL